MSGFEERDKFNLEFDLCESIVNYLHVALYFTSPAAPVLEIRLCEVRNCRSFRENGDKNVPV